MTIFPLHYFPSVSWFSALLSEKEVFLEQWQNFRKQEGYNRMLIQGPNKIQSLSIPVKRTGENTPLCKSTVSFDEDWRKNHWKSLETAYRRSPYFEYYEDRIEPFFKNKEHSLVKHNMQIIKVIAGLLGIDTAMTLTASYEDPEFYARDLRSVFTRRGQKEKEWFVPSQYKQVFRDFEPDLSVLDLLFNEGPESKRILLASLKS